MELTTNRWSPPFIASLVVFSASHARSHAAARSLWFKKKKVREGKKNGRGMKSGEERFYHPIGSASSHCMNRQHDVDLGEMAK